MADAILSTAFKLLVLSLFFRLKLNNFYITSSININSTDWSNSFSSTRPISIGLEAYRSRPRISQAGAILDSCPELGYFSPIANLQQTETSTTHVNNRQTGTTSPLAFLQQTKKHLYAHISQKIRLPNKENIPVVSVTRQ